MLSSGSVGENGLWVPCTYASVTHSRITVRRLLPWGWVIRLGGIQTLVAPDDKVQTAMTRLFSFVGRL